MNEECCGRDNDSLSGMDYGLLGEGVAGGQRKLPEGSTFAANNGCFVGLSKEKRSERFFYCAVAMLLVTTGGNLVKPKKA